MLEKTNSPYIAVKCFSLPKVTGKKKRNPLVTFWSHGRVTKKQLLVLQRVAPLKLRERRGSNPISTRILFQCSNLSCRSHKYYFVCFNGKAISRGQKYDSEKRCLVAISIASQNGATKTVFGNTK